VPSNLTGNQPDQKQNKNLLHKFLFCFFLLPERYGLAGLGWLKTPA
jgi:hypothetical protein